MKKKLFLLLWAIFALIGLCFVAYPSIADYINETHNKGVISGYNQNTQTLSAIEIETQKSKAQRFNELLAQATFDTETENQEYKTLMESYYDILDFDGIICTVEIPQINVNLPVYHGFEDNDEVLKKGCVHLLNTSLPVGGESTHSVISAHSGYPAQKFFDDLEDLEIGDTFTVNVLNERLEYKVCDINIVEPDDSGLLEIVDGKDYVTLVTCYPFSVNTHRLLVRGERVQEQEIEVTTINTATTDEAHTDEQSFNYIFIALAVFIIAVVMIVIIRTRRS